MVLISSLADRVKSCRDLSQARGICHGLEQGNYLDIVYVANLVVEMYGKCGSIDDARSVFDRIRRPNLFSWTVMIAAYARNGHFDEALELFERKMPMRDTASSNAAIVIHVNKGDLHGARALFDSIVERDIVSWSTMITAYAQSGQIEQAKALFDQMPRRNVVAWTAMVAAYAQSGHPREAREFFEQMPESNLVSWNTVLHGFAEAGEAKEVAEIFEVMPDRDIVSWNTLIVAYARRSDLSTAKKLFDRLPETSVVSWNLIIQACASSRDLVLFLFSSMIIEDVEPDSITFTWIINSDCFGGGLERGLELFWSMENDHGVSPRLDHYNSTLNSLGRAGRMEDLRQAIEQMWFLPDLVTWKTALAASRRQGESYNLAERTAWAMNSFDANLFIMLSSFITKR